EVSVKAVVAVDPQRRMSQAGGREQQQRPEAVFQDQGKHESVPSRCSGSPSALGGEGSIESISRPCHGRRSRVRRGAVVACVERVQELIDAKRLEEDEAKPILPRLDQR